jgi:hypothetical protein
VSSPLLVSWASKDITSDYQCLGGGHRGVTGGKRLCWERASPAGDRRVFRGRQAEPATRPSRVAPLVKAGVEHVVRPRLFVQGDARVLRALEVVVQRRLEQERCL